MSAQHFKELLAQPDCDLGDLYETAMDVAGFAQTSPERVSVLITFIDSIAKLVPEMRTQFVELCKDEAGVEL